MKTLLTIIITVLSEMDDNLLAATDRIDLLWHELAKLTDVD